jgi:uncharacterized protein YbjT (DUF2867 family)
MPVLLFAFVTSLVTGIVFGVAPGYMAARVDPIEALRGASRSTARTGSLSRKTLVVFRAVLSLVLLSASGLLTTVLHKLENQDIGIDQNHSIVASIEPRLAGYKRDQLTPLYQRIHDSLSSIPGVSAVALCTYSPQNGKSWGSLVWIDGRPDPVFSMENAVFWDRVTPGYFDAVGNPIIRGRGISERDTPASPPVAVINEAFARKYFNGEDPIGKHFGRNGRSSTHQYEIVGIAKDIRNLTDRLDQPAGPFYFLPEAQHDAGSIWQSAEISPGSHFMHDIVIVTRPGASLSIQQVRQAMASVDPNLPVIALNTLSEQVTFQFAQQRLIARLTSFFGILSLILASIGLYGVTAYNAGRRTNEIGVRMALGASRGNVFALVLRGAFALIAFGLLLGVPLSAVAGRFLGHQLYGLNPYNPAVITVAVVVLGFSALAASLIPALRASSISPLEALRVGVAPFAPSLGTIFCMHRILVIGATGTVGRQVLAQLPATGVQVRALARNPHTAGLPPHVDVVCGDLTLPETLDACLDAVDSVFLVWTAPPTAAAPALERIAKRARRIVFLSAPLKTAHPLFQQPNPARALAAQIEQLIETSGLQWTFLRPGMFAANALSWWAPQIRAGADVVRWPYADTPTAPIHERDIAAVAVRALCEDGHAGAEYVLTGPESLSHFEQVSTIGRVIGRSLRLEEISPEQARRELLTSMPLSIVNMLLDAWAAALGQPAHVTSTIEKLTGAPARSFHDWATDHAAEFGAPFLVSR